jgi:hypothetical protein
MLQFSKEKKAFQDQKKKELLTERSDRIDLQI